MLDLLLKFGLYTGEAVSFSVQRLISSWHRWLYWGKCRLFFYTTDMPKEPYVIITYPHLMPYILTFVRLMEVIAEAQMVSAVIQNNGFKYVVL